MPTMIQTHLITCKDWAAVKDTAKCLKHIIRKCNPPTPTMPMMATGATVPGLYSHIAHSVDKEEVEIPQPFTAKLMNDTPIEIFIDNGATPSILPLRTYNKFPILHTYLKTESNTPIHTGGGLITSHFWLEILLKLQHQTIQIKALVCDSECPYDLILG